MYTIRYDYSYAKALWRLSISTQASWSWSKKFAMCEKKASLGGRSSFAEVEKYFCVSAQHLKASLELETAENWWKNHGNEALGP